ncbi:MAG: chemotaxis-specific protein-glutamate methyltransferase CheB [Chloroflexota bacterium]|nr:chemotaxis-specific protein-glutamate methyltransferase CheB [Chloroflexota bacterium]
MRVLVVDDSAVQRSILITLIHRDPELTVIGWASNGADAVRAAALLTPDVIAMDLRMPEMDGIEATRQILQQTPTPIVLVTAGFGSTAVDEQRLAFDALEAGVLAVLTKPDLGPEGDAATRELHRILKNMARVRMVRRWSIDRLRTSTARTQASPSELPGVHMEVVAIGASTGGPPVLRTILVGLPSGFEPPVLIVQHIADDFAISLVEWLRSQCALPIHIGVHGQCLNQPGIWVAPPGRHMGVSRRSLVLVDGPPISLHRPSVTHLFQSMAREYGPAAVGVLLTGMGDDGAVGLRDLKSSGGMTIAQDEATSVVFGMPSAAIKLGVVDHVLPPPAIALMLLQRSST